MFVCVYVGIVDKSQNSEGEKYSPKKQRKWFESTQCLEMTLGILVRKHMEFGEECVFKWRPLKLAYFVYDG